MKRSFVVEGMTCQHCAASVSEELSEIGGVVGVEVDVESGRVIVTSDTNIDDAAVACAIDEAGYRLAS
ncbi:MAG: heavy-metal-associated domain-containing protein [Rhodococcus sp. (in: high G+C Gram-positive bacteria)]|jgi:copper chaperone CopZ|uniref:heavy-metal-associated domain-containing protein n=1 Tax=Rhodococcus sp. EPR-157 TaxID=1813677 RepID=UPI0007BC1874|nr:heavy-metal-associated domain-containing protein [Rhodococcus sp. EPR-157]KZF00147.1 cation-transporting ATPase [Rhodococcus sp. EPR-157]